jgi:MYXO-CTERM domain-containing protein
MQTRWRLALPRVMAVTALMASLAHAPPARGQEVDPAHIATLEAELEAELEAGEAALASGDCAVACKALESMIRSAARICELEPGERCEAARRKVTEAKRRVRDACPDCDSAREEAALPRPTVPERPPPKGAGDGDVAVPEPAGAEASTVDKRGGGCGACAVGRGGGATPALALLGLLWALRRRRRARRPASTQA